MMNYIWGGMMVIAVICGIATGNIDNVSQAILTGGSQAIELCLTLLGMLILWGGLTAVMQNSGLSNLLGNALSPFVGLLFPELRHHATARNAIAMNVAANILGLGNAATPFGLQAMKELHRMNHYSKRASNSMITFVVLNSVSVQLIPTGIAVLRARFSSADPMGIIVPVWLVSGISVIVGIGLAILINRRRAQYG